MEVTILDQTGALIPNAYVLLQAEGGENHVADISGRTYRARVAPGSYTLLVSAHGFAPFAEEVQLAGDSRREITVTLTVHVTERIDVSSESGLSIAPGNSLITLSGEELRGLPSNPRDLVNQLLHMAGSPAQPDEVVIYVNGFREKRNIPPLEAIDVIRISVDPFSAEFPEPGSRRIEITTKPGEQDFNGQFGMDFTDESLNARNAF
ncbi:MAG TPA: carboxypeptidase regulatory-like domain-containing protein, partial [Vicinamibacteria bacterium]|nr:carboxypeptidase regulatory-like domain-containing protein [Vicinamibacteria bacterium]